MVMQGVCKKCVLREGLDGKMGDKCYRYSQLTGMPLARSCAAERESESGWACGAMGKFFTDNPSRVGEGFNLSEVFDPE